MITTNTIALFCLDRYLLLAGQSQYVHMGRRFRRRGNEIEWTDLLLPLAIIVCVVGIAWLVTQVLKYRERRLVSSSNILFAELCKSHGLDWSSQQLLRSLASAVRAPTPAHVFVDPSCFDVDRLGASFNNRKSQVIALREKLFAEPQSNDSSPRT